MVRISETRIIIGAIILGITILSDLAAERCKKFSVSKPHSGRYCPGDGMVVSHLLPQQCLYVCIAYPACKAYNFNATDGTCNRFTAPCLQAIPDAVMEFVVFTEKSVNQCYDWVPYSSGDAIEPRMVFSDDTYRIVGLMQRDGHDRVGYFDAQQSKCYASWESSEFRSDQGYPCQRLRIVEDCVVFWVPYTAGNPINPRPVIGGHMANGDTVYVTKFDYNFPLVLSLVGHYVEGADHTISLAGSVIQSSSTMMMLTVL